MLDIYENPLGSNLENLQFPRIVRYAIPSNDFRILLTDTDDSRRIVECAKIPDPEGEFLFWSGGWMGYF